MDCKHENIHIAFSRNQLLCRRCAYDFKDDEVVILTKAQHQSLLNVIEHFAKLINDNPDLVNELCKCYAGFPDYADITCPICDERSPLWKRGQELEALDALDKGDNECGL